jgi:Glycoside hydrolase family 44
MPLANTSPRIEPTAAALATVAAFAALAAGISCGSGGSSSPAPDGGRASPGQSSSSGSGSGSGALDAGPGGAGGGDSAVTGPSGAADAGGDARSAASDAGAPSAACTPACGTRVCGTDGCGGTCGACGFTQLCSSAGSCTTPSTAGALLVDAASQLTPISSGVYGMGYPGNESMKVASLNRWGGDEASLYNWQLDVFNGSTWSTFWPPSDLPYQNSSGCISDTPGMPGGTTCPDWFVRYNRGYKADTIMTVPIIGWMAKDGTSVGDPSGQNPGKNAVAAGAGVMTSWVQHLATTFGDAAHGGVKYYQLDNEPDNWKNSQTDVHPAAANHTELWTRTQTYASAIKAGDPSAQVLFMCTMDPSDLVELNFVESGLSDPAFAGHTSSPQYSLAAWMLQQAAAYEAQHGARIVDCLDTHYPVEVSGGAAPIESTRSLWDPTFDTGFYFGQGQALFPRMQQWINQNYPGTGICVSEYFTNNDGTGGNTLDPFSGVLQAETLGLYGKYGLRAAAYWNGVTDVNGGHLPVYNAFAMYRNYDGVGHTFGPVSIGAVSPIQDITVFASSDSATAPTTLWVMIINKMTSTQHVTVDVASFTPAANAHVYQSTPTTGPTPLPDVAVSGNAFQVSLPQYSISLVVVPKG